MMMHAANLNASHQRHSEFFPQFPRESNLWRFAVFDLAAWEFPLQRHGLMAGALAHQDLFMLEDQRCDHLLHGR